MCYSSVPCSTGRFRSITETKSRVIALGKQRLAQTSCCNAQLRCRRAERDDIQKGGRGPDGALEFAADNTAVPFYDTRVWLHMYEGEHGLEYTFDRNSGAAHYMYDFTGFQEWRVEQNALLSDEAKCLMFKLWSRDPVLWSEEELAKQFRIRVQRALAIIKIKQEEFSQVRCTVSFALLSDEATCLMFRLWSEGELAKQTPAGDRQDQAGGVQSGVPRLFATSCVHLQHALAITDTKLDEISQVRLILC